MAKSNRDRIGEVMDALKGGLGPFALRELKLVYKRDVGREIAALLSSNAYEVPRAALESDAALLATIDTHGWLKVLWLRWNDVFQAKLGQTYRSYVNLLQNARNDWAHQKAFTNDEAYRIADLAAVLLEAVGAPKQAQSAREVAQELLRLRFDAEQKRAQKPIEGGAETPSATTRPGLKPWRLVVRPHPDVANGRYTQAEFAADLSQVVQGKADPEYGDPKEFFRRTYLTEGLLSLLVTGVKRLSGQGGDPVVQLQTSFGGGKTHSMLALYHLFSGQIGFSEIPDGDKILAQIEQTDDRIEAQRAVIVGTGFNATEPRRYHDVTTHTLWGEIAYQLGGLAGYQMVERADLSGVSPGADTLVELLEKFGPALIMIDELVAFARNLYGITERLPAGSFDAVMTFIQSLTEAVKRSSDSMLLVSIPESAIEIGGEGGKMTLEILAKTIGRVESVWKPVTANESFAIVRRRLFTTEIDYPARDAVVTAFRELYAANTGEFPAGVVESSYFLRMKDAYPIHPELFDRLYQDWSTLDRFQRTRGVLRLMAAVIHQLWLGADQSLLIMPASMPLDAAPVRNELLRYLPETWPAIVDTDVDGEASRTYAIDRSVPVLGQYAASRRVARSIFMGSAPSVANTTVRGVEEVRIRLATVQPGEPLAVFGDALRRMSNQLTYLYTDGSRYWYDTRPTVNRIAQDRAQNIHPDLIHKETLDRLRTVKYNRQDFAAAHIVYPGSSDVADEPSTRIVVFTPEYAHKRGDMASKALEAAKETLGNRGTAPRLYRNMLLFIAPDANDAEAFDKALREYLAWKSISEEEEPLNLDAQQRKQVRANLKRTEETVLARLQETYSWLLVPAQPEATGPVEFQVHRIAGADNFYERAARKLRQSGLLVYKWSPDLLRSELDLYLWRDQSHLGIKQLWEYLACYCYLPRLFDHEVLVQSVREGIARLVDAPFAYATLVNGEGKYQGLSLHQAGSQVYFDDKAVLVRPEIAQKQLEETHPPEPPPFSVYQPGPSLSNVNLPRTVEAGASYAPIPIPPRPPQATRYHGAVTLNPQRLNREMATIVEEIIQRLTSLTGVDIEITLEIAAQRTSGFDEATVRTINENSRTLKFSSHGFEGGNP